MARLTVGQVVPCIAFRFVGDGPCNGFFYRNFYPWTHVLESVSIIKLNVVEHHLVKTEYAPEDFEPNVDGYVLHDAEGNAWHNEYPRASDSMNTDVLFIVERHITPEMVAAQWLGDNEDALLSYQFLDFYLNSLLRGISLRKEKEQHSKSDIKGFTQDLANLQDHYTATVEQAKRELNCSITCEPRTMTRTGGSVEVLLPHSFKHTIVFNEVNAV